MPHHCSTDLAPCAAPATWAYRWPGSAADAHLCDAHMLAMSAACDPRLIDVRRIPRDGATLEAFAVPGEESPAWRIVAAPPAPPPPRGHSRAPSEPPGRADG